MKTQNKETGSWYDINSNMIYVLKNHIWKKIKLQLLTLKIRIKWNKYLFIKQKQNVFNIEISFSVYLFKKYKKDNMYSNVEHCQYLSIYK